MRLVSRIMLCVMVSMLILLPLWGLFFYRTLTREMQDEVDDNLELYAEQVIETLRNGSERRQEDAGWSSYSYSIEQVDQKVYQQFKSGEFSHGEIVVDDDTLPVRILELSFRDSHGDFALLTARLLEIEKEDLIETGLRWILILFGSLLVVLLLVVWLVTDSNLKPLGKLAKWAGAYRLGRNTTLPDNSTRVKEFVELHRALSGLVSRSERIYNQQNEFIGNAAHEMQTPIAVCGNRLELLSQSELTPAQLDDVMKTRRTLDYMSRLNRSLLFLAKIDNGQFDSVERVDMVDTVSKLLEDLDEIYAYKNIDVILTGRDVNCCATMNPTLAEALAANLLKNAFVHNVSGGRIAVTFEPTALVIANDGGSQALESDKIFRRFHSSRHTEGSSGLGLAIVDSIIKYYNFDIRYDFVNGMHRFRVNFRFIS